MRTILSAHILCLPLPIAIHRRRRPSALYLPYDQPSKRSVLCGGCSRDRDAYPFLCAFFDWLCWDEFFDSAVCQIRDSPLDGFREYILAIAAVLSGQYGCVDGSFGVPNPRGQAIEVRLRNPRSAGSARTLLPRLWTWRVAASNIHEVCGLHDILEFD